MNASLAHTALPLSWGVCALFPAVCLSLWLYCWDNFGGVQFLRYLVTPDGFRVVLLLGASVLATCAVSVYAVVRVTFGELTPTHVAALGRKITKDNALLQVFLMTMRDERTNAAELLIWSVVLFVYTSLRICVSAAETHVELDDTRNISKALIYLSIILTLNCAFITVCSWVFWQAGAGLLLGMHYEGVQIALVAAALIVSLCSEDKDAATAEIVLRASAHLVGIVQWLHFLMDSALYVGFPIQFLLLFKLRRTAALLGNDLQRYRGCHDYTEKLLRTCSPLTEGELLALRDEQCCICWKSFASAQSMRLPCRHVHHAYPPLRQCLRRLMMSATEMKCPLCKQPMFSGETLSGAQRNPGEQQIDTQILENLMSFS